MNNEKKGLFGYKFNIGLQNLYYVGTLITLLFIMAQVFYAKRSMTESSEWEKAKLTIENIDRFKKNLTEVKLYDSDVLYLANGTWPDFSTAEGRNSADTLRTAYESLFSNETEMGSDLLRTIDVLDVFAYPIIMGYASEMGSFQSVMREYSLFSNFMMPYAFNNMPVGHHAKLLYRLWRARIEYVFLVEKDLSAEYLKELNKPEHIKTLLCFDEAEVTPEALKRYGKKLEKEIKKIQKEIEAFRKNSLK